MATVEKVPAILAEHDIVAWAAGEKVAISTKPVPSHCSFHAAGGVVAVDNVLAEIGENDVATCAADQEVELVARENGVIQGPGEDEVRRASRCGEVLREVAGAEVVARDALGHGIIQ